MARSEDCEGLQKVPELTISQAQMKKREAEKDKQKNNKKKRERTDRRFVHAKDGRKNKQA